MDTGALGDVVVSRHFENAAGILDSLDRIRVPISTVVAIGFSGWLRLRKTHDFTNSLWLVSDRGSHTADWTKGFALFAHLIGETYSGRVSVCPIADRLGFAQEFRAAA